MSPVSQGVKYSQRKSEIEKMNVVNRCSIVKEDGLLNELIWLENMKKLIDDIQNLERRNFVLKTWQGDGFLTYQN